MTPAVCLFTDRLAPASQVVRMRHYINTATRLSAMPLA